MKKGCYKDDGSVAALFLFLTGQDYCGRTVMTALPLSQSAIAVICDRLYVK